MASATAPAWAAGDGRAGLAFRRGLVRLRATLCSDVSLKTRAAQRSVHRLVGQLRRSGQGQGGLAVLLLGIGQMGQTLEEVNSVGRWSTLSVRLAAVDG